LFDRVDNSDEHAFTTKVDYTLSRSHTIFGRLQYNKCDSPGASLWKCRSHGPPSMRPTGAWKAR
jgi:hypothetical protein